MSGNMVRYCSECGHCEDKGEKLFKIVNDGELECPICGNRLHKGREAYVLGLTEYMSGHLKFVVDRFPENMRSSLVKLVRAVITANKEDIVVAQVDALHREFGSGNPDNMLIRVTVIEEFSGSGKTHEIFANIDKNKYKTDEKSLGRIAKAIANKTGKTGNYPLWFYKPVKTIIQYEGEEGK